MTNLMAALTFGLLIGGVVAWSRDREVAAWFWAPACIVGLVLLSVMT